MNLTEISLPDFTSRLKARASSYHPRDSLRHSAILFGVAGAFRLQFPAQPDQPTCAERNPASTSIMLGQEASSYIGSEDCEGSKVHHPAILLDEPSRLHDATRPCRPVQVPLLALPRVGRRNGDRSLHRFRAVALRTIVRSILFLALCLLPAALTHGQDERLRPGDWVPAVLPERNGPVQTNRVVVAKALNAIRQGNLGDAEQIIAEAVRDASDVQVRRLRTVRLRQDIADRLRERGSVAEARGVVRRGIEDLRRSIKETTDVRQKAATSFYLGTILEHHRFSSREVKEAYLRALEYFPEHAAAKVRLGKIEAIERERARKLERLRGKGAEE